MSKVKDIKDFPAEKELSINVEDTHSGKDDMIIGSNQARKEIGELDIAFDVDKIISIMLKYQSASCTFCNANNNRRIATAIINQWRNQDI